MEDVRRRRVSVVTGANSGIGKEVASGLMARGDHVVMACRRLDACELARAELLQRHPSATCQCLQLDLADYASSSASSVRSFARGFRAQFPGAQLAVLVNNAGVMCAPPEPDGGDGLLRPNHFGPFLLTRLLLPSMSPHARVVTVGSEAHRRGALQVEQAGGGGGGRFRLDEGRVQWYRAHWYRQYARSKLGNLLMTAQLSRTLTARGSTVTAYCASPGRVNTNIFSSLGALGPPARLSARWLFQTPEQGARTVLQAAIDPELSGRHVLYLHAGREKQASPAARDAEVAATLWCLSVQETGLSAAEDASLWPKH